MLLLSSTTYLWELYGSSIAVAIRSLEHSLSTRLIPLGLLEAGAQCAPYNCTFQTGSKRPYALHCQQQINRSQPTRECT